MLEILMYPTYTPVSARGFRFILSLSKGLVLHLVQKVFQRFLRMFHLLTIQNLETHPNRWFPLTP